MIVSLITLALLVGSVVLQRIVFRAAESQASVFLTPSTFIVKPQGLVSLDIVSNFSQEAFVASSQFVVEFDPKHLEFNSAVASSGFTTTKVTPSEGKISWLLSPAKSQGIVGLYNGQTTVGRLNFLATTEGGTTISIDPRLSVISAVDPEGKYALYNAIRSTQNAVGEITNLSNSTKVTPTTVGLDQPNGTIFSTQRIASSKVIPLDSRALIAVDLRYLGNIEVNFGPTEELGNKLIGVGIDTTHLIDLQGLASNANYFYQLKVLSENGKTIITSPVRTFVTVGSGDGPIDANLSELVPVTQLPANKTDVLVVLRNEKGEVVEPKEIELKIITGEATVVPVAQTNPYIVTTSTALGSRQTVTLGAYVDNKEIDRAEITFDPGRTQQFSPEINSDLSVKFDRSVQLTLASLLAVLLLSGLVLVRLLKVH